MRFDSIIIGAGAAGMMAAITAARAGRNVAVFEKNDRPGKKLRLTGKGRCNVTNFCTRDEFMENVPVNNRFMYSSFSAFTPQGVMDFFENAGVPLKVERGNRVFPVSDKASDVADTLLRFTHENGCRLISSEVHSLIIKDNAVCGVKTLSGESIYADKVIIATGGKSYPATGSTGTGYKLAKQAGHTVIPPKPSLVPVVSDDLFCKELQGLSLRNISLKVISKKDGKAIYSDFGEMLFTHFGVSGPVILSASAYLNNKKLSDYCFSIDLKPALSEKQLDLRILRDLEAFINKDIKNSLGKLLPSKLIPVVIERAEIPINTKCNSITKEQRHRLLEILKSFTVNISGFRPIEEAIITSGGVSTKEINPKTMESKICRGLYFAGEVIDVDAYTGGFNLQIAFSTGYLAGTAVY